MARKQVSRKRRVKKNIATGVAHIHSTFNNTRLNKSVSQQSKLKLNDKLP